jgi:flagellar hook-associated protein 1 FlgK
MSLFGMLGTTARALDAQRYGLDVVGNNIANVNTAGYTRRVVDFGAVPPPDRFSAGNGVEVLHLRSQRDRLFDQRLFDEAPLAERQAAIVDALGLAEVSLGASGSSLDAALADFFDAFAALADAPTDTTARGEVLADAQALASVFHSLSARLTESEQAADARVRGDVDRLNGLTSRLAFLNGAISSAPEGEALQLRDEQVAVAVEISGILGVQVLELADGTMQVATENGRALVIGNDAYPLATSSTPPTGHAAIMAGGLDITAEVRTGSLGGLLAVRDQAIPGYRTDLDTLAYGVADAVNTLHATGYDLSQAAGGSFFVPLGTAAGAAALLQVDPALAADTSRIAAAGIPSSGDNAVARQLADLRDAPVIGGRTPSAAWAGLVYRVGSDVHQATRERESRREIVHQVETLRDSVSGVSIDEEAALMMRFQRAYEANARFFTVVDEVLQTLLSLKR